jgi:hypothetical protein
MPKKSGCFPYGNRQALGYTARNSPAFWLMGGLKNQNQKLNS